MTEPAFATVRTPGTRSYGPVAAARLREVGVELLPWQQLVLDQLLEVDDDGALTRKTAVLIVPRRNGKSLAVAARLLFGALFLGEQRISYSAHRFDAALEMYRLLCTLTQHPALDARVTARPRGQARERIVFDNGGEITIRTRTGSGGRGLEADALVLDEALELGHDHVAALTPLLAKSAARGRGQVIYASSAGTASSLVLAQLRDRGRAASGEAPPGLAYFEWAADRDDDWHDPAVWKRANPSLGTSIIREDFVADALTRLTPEAFAREHLGVWGTEDQLPIIDPTIWAELVEHPAPARGHGARWVAFDMAPLFESARVLGFYRTVDDRIAVHVLHAIDDPRGISVDGYARRVLDLVTRYDPELIAYDGFTGAPVAQLLTANGWERRLRRITGTMASAGVAALVQAVRAGGVVHDGNEQLRDDLGRAVARPFSDGGRVFGRKGSTSGSIAGAIALGAGFAVAGDELLG